MLARVLACNAKVMMLVRDKVVEKNFPNPVCK